MAIFRGMSLPQAELAFHANLAKLRAKKELTVILDENSLRTIKRINEAGSSPSLAGVRDAFISSKQRPELLEKPFEYEPVMNAAMTASTRKDSDYAWDFIATKLGLGANPVEPIKTMALLLKDVKAKGSIGSLKPAWKMEPFSLR